MADTKKLNVIIGGDAKDLRGATKKAQTSLTGLQKTANNLGGSLAGALGGAVLIAGIGKAITKIAEFEKTMRRVSIISKGSEKDLTSLARTLGGTTQFTATQAGEAMQFLAQAGFDANQILSATPGVLELAAAAQLDLARAADIASNVLSAYSLSADEMNRVNDVLVNTANNANTSVEQFAESFKVVGPLAKSAGVSLEETSAIIGLLGNAGLQGSMAGTGLRSTLLALINPNEALQKAMADAGTEIKRNNDGSLNLIETLKQLKETNISAGDASQAFGRIALSSALVMIDAADAAGGMVEKVSQIGTASETAAGQMDTLSGDILTLQSAFESLVLEGGRWNDSIRSSIQLLTGFAKFLNAGLSMELVNAKDNVLEMVPTINKWIAANKPLTKSQEALIDSTKESVKVLNEHGISLSDLGLKLDKVKSSSDASFERLIAWREELNKGRTEIEKTVVAFNDWENAAVNSFNSDEKLRASQKEYQELLALGNVELGDWINNLDKVGEKEDEVAEKIDETTAVAIRQRIALKDVTKSSLEAAAATAALAIANGQSAKEIINAALAVAIAEAIKDSAFTAANPIAGLLLAGVAIAGIKALFNNIPAFATGTNFAPGGMALVGERGPEIMHVPRGAGITPNHKIGMGNISINVNGFIGNPTELAREIVIVLNNQSGNVRRTSFV